MLGKLKKFKVIAILVLEYKKIDDYKTMGKIFHYSIKLIVNDSDIDKEFELTNRSIITKNFC